VCLRLGDPLPTILADIGASHHPAKIARFSRRLNLPRLFNPHNVHAT